MNVKESFISMLMLLCLLLLSPAEVAARSGERVRRLDRREHIQYEGWQQLLPTHLKVQYAGGMGFLSAGVGWDYGQRAVWESDILVGFLPSHYADDFRLTFTLRQNYTPWSVKIAPRMDLEPLSLALYANVITGNEFWNREPSHYPHDGRGYYKFSSRTRLHLAVGQRFRLLTSEASAIRSLSLYYEFSINDLMVVSAVNNRTLEFSDVVHFSLGAKLHIFK